MTILISDVHVTIANVYVLIVNVYVPIRQCLRDVMKLFHVIISYARKVEKVELNSLLATWKYVSLYFSWWNPCIAKSF